MNEADMRPDLVIRRKGSNTGLTHRVVGKGKDGWWRCVYTDGPSFANSAIIHPGDLDLYETV